MSPIYETFEHNSDIIGGLEETYMMSYNKNPKSLLKARRAGGLQESSGLNGAVFVEPKPLSF